MHKIGSFEIVSVSIPKIVDKAGLKSGINDVGNHFIKLSAENEVEYVIDKVCNHAGGRLILKNSKAVCPMHGWQLNLDTLEYNDSHVCKEKIPYEIDAAGDIILSDIKSHLVNRYKGEKKGIAKLRWLNHATVYIECNGISLITDPWLFGPAFMTGWWLASPSPQDSVELLKNADYIFISHNHPDHLHAETLSLLAKDKKIIVADFASKSSEKYLRSLGFENIIILPFNELFELTAGFQISILKSGDFRDDAGIYLCANGHEFLLTVDANFLNGYILPSNIDLLMTSFAGGASGFPLCFENFSEEEKTNVLKRNRGAAKFSARQYLIAAKPAFYMPYAGMFKEYAARDKYIAEHNIKNSVQDYESIADSLGAMLVAPASDIELIFEDGRLEKRLVAVAHLSKEDDHFYIGKLKEDFLYNENLVIDYFRKSEYYGKQVVQIIPTNDNFEQVAGSIIYADFGTQVFKVISESEVVETIDGYKVMQLKVRPEVLMCVIENKLPWEDLSIGFQMRVKRYPNEYESDFWYHFTNNYIGGKNFRYSSFCGACTVVNQNPIWIK